MSAHGRLRLQDLVALLHGVGDSRTVFAIGSILQLIVTFMPWLTLSLPA